MLFRFFAITVFLALHSAAPACAEEFAKRFTTVDPPRAVPAFVFQDDKGVTHDLKDYKGRYVLLNLWATWCGPCVKEMPSLDGLQGKFGKNELSVVALNEDRGGVTAARAFYTAHTLQNLPIFVDRFGEIPYALHASGYPATYLINPNGMEIGYLEGEADWTAPDAVSFLKAKTAR